MLYILHRLGRVQMQAKKSLLVPVADQGNAIVHLLLEKNSSQFLTTGSRR